YNNDAVRQKFANVNSGAQGRLDFRGRDGQQVLRPNQNRPDIGNSRTPGDRPNLANRGIGNRDVRSNRPRRDTGFSNIQAGGRVNAQSVRGLTSLANHAGGGHSFAQARGGGGAPHVAARGGGGRRSDIRVKHDIVLLGRLANGLGYY